MHTILRVMLLSLLLLPTLKAAPAPWAQLQVGMSAEQTARILGLPLMQIRGRGFEKWTYDNGAEVLLHGAVVGWTAPASAGLLARSEDVWSRQPPGEYYATLHAALPKPVLTTPNRPVRPHPAAYAGVGYEEHLRNQKAALGERAG